MFSHRRDSTGRSARGTETKQTIGHTSERIQRRVSALVQSQAGAGPNPRENSVEFSSRPEGHKSDMTHPCRRYEIGRVHHLARKYFADYAAAAAAGSESVEISP